MYLFTQYLLNGKYVPGARGKTTAYKADKSAYKADKSLCSHGGYILGIGGIQ